MTNPEIETESAEPLSAVKKGRRDGVLQIALVAGVLVAGVAANMFLSNSGSESQIRVSGPEAMTVETVMPDIRDTEVRILETGTVQVRNAIDLSPQVSGRVVMVNPALASGGNFEKGDILFRLDDADYLANLERARADLSAKQADLKVEQSEADIAIREWELVRPGESVPENVARAPQLDRARAAVRSAEAAVADARLDLNRVAYSLPFDGRVLSTTIEVGQNLAAGQSYGRAYDPAGLEVSVPVNAAVIECLSPATGRQATIRTRQLAPSQPAQSFSAIVTRADAELDAQTRLARLIVEFEDDVSLLPGDFVDVEIAGPTISNAHIFPERAVQENQSVWIVEQSTLRRRQPTLVSADQNMIVALPFDVGDGIVLTTMRDQHEGDVVLVTNRVSSGGGQP